MMTDGPTYEPGEPPRYTGDVQVRRQEFAAPVRPEVQDDRSLGELFSDLTTDFRTLVRQEIELSKTEATQKARKASKNVGYIGAGGAVAYAGLIAIVFAVGFLLEDIMPDWLAFLITGALVAFIGYSMIQKGIKALKNTDFSLNRTTETLKEDKQWLKQEMK